MGLKLIEAAKRGDVEEVMRRMAAGIHPDYRDAAGNTALMVAAYNGNIEILRVLLNSGADINASNKGGRTALMGAAREGHTEVIHLLLDRGANINAANNSGWTALHKAASSGFIEILELLLEKGALTNAADEDDKTAYDLAQEGPVRDLLRQAKSSRGGASNNAGAYDRMQSFDRKTSLDSAAVADPSTANTDPQFFQDNYSKALIRAVSAGNTLIVKQLLSKGADIHYEDGNGDSALMLAASLGYEYIARVLLESDSFGKGEARYER